MRALWDYTIFQGAVEFFLKKKQNLLLMCCFAKLGMGWAGQRQLTKEKGNKPWTAWCPFPGFPSPLNGSFWSFSPPIGPPAFPSLLPNRILQAAASGLHPKTPLPLPAPSLSHPLLLPGQGWVWGALSSFLSPWWSCDPHTHWDHTLICLGTPQFQGTPSPTNYPACAPGGAEKGVQCTQKVFWTRENRIFFKFFAWKMCWAHQQRDPLCPSRCPVCNCCTCFKNDLKNIYFTSP